MLCATVFTYVGALGLNAQERRSAVLGFTKDSVACNVRLWLAGMGVVLVLAAMTAKTYRLYRIIENTTLVQVSMCSTVCTYNSNKFMPLNERTLEQTLSKL